MNIDYQELVNADVQHRNDARQEERGSDAGEWHPSSLTGCPRRSVYDFKGYDKTDETEIRSLRIMDKGTDLHEEVQAMVIRHVLLNGGQPSDYTIEVKVEHAGIKGSCDGILYGEVHEYKSIGPNGKKFLYPKPYGRRDGTNIPQPKPEHLKQARIYQRCLQAMGVWVKPTVTIVYFDRDDGSVLQFQRDAWLDVEWYEFLAEIGELEDHAYSGTLPPRLPFEEKKGETVKNWECGYCPFATRCWEVDAE